MKTMRLFLMISTAFLCLYAHAGSPAPNQQSCMFRSYSASNDSLDHVRFQNNLEHWRRMKMNGLILTSVGGGLFLTGQVCLWTSVARDINTNISSDQDKLWVSGAIITAAAVALLIPGAIMLARGSKRYRGLKRHTKGDPDFHGVTF